MKSHWVTVLRNRRLRYLLNKTLALRYLPTIFIVLLFGLSLDGQLGAIFQGNRIINQLKCHQMEEKGENESILKLGNSISKFETDKEPFEKNQ